MKEVEEETLGALVRLTFEAFRAECSPSETESSALDRLPAIDELRKAVEAKDLKWLLPMVHSAPDATAGLACSLLRYLIDEPGVAPAMMERWNAASPYLKNRLMWRLLEYAQLKLEWHDRFLEFVLDSWDVFNEFNMRFYGQSEEAVARVQQRRKASPAQKKWVYWLSLPSVLDNPTRLAEFLREGLQSGDDFSKKAIRAYQERIVDQ